MFSVITMHKNKQQHQLLKYYSCLNTVDKNTLLTFAEYLSKREGDVENNDIKTTVIVPVVIQRPENETVINAIKRLTASYPMVDREQLLHSISALMTAHMMQGKKARLVIDELEEMFLSKATPINLK